MLYVSLHLQAEKILFESALDHEYAGISGVPDFTKAAAELAFGAGSPVTKNGLVGQIVCKR